MTECNYQRVSRRRVLGGLAAAGAAGWLGGPAAAEQAAPETLPLGACDVRRFGAKGDGLANDTRAIQAAVDACAAAGGGTVLLSGGVYLSGTIFLRSNVTLWIDAGAVLLGSREIADYPSVTPEVVYLYRARFTKSLIYAERQQRIALAGRGLIDGQGQHFHAKSGDDALRPYLIRFSQCSNVSVRDLSMHNSARWLSHYLACENVTIDGLTIHAPIRENRDGIDVDSCNRVRIANCDISTGDDAIVLKATTPDPCRQVAVTNCTLSSMASALKLGTESNGGFEDITFNNCTVYDTAGSGINLGLVDGGVCQRVNVANITMSRVGVPIFLRLENRARPIPDLPPPGMGRMRDVMISNVQAAGADKLGCSITGIPGFPIENVTVQNVRLRFSGGGTAADASRAIPEVEAGYPSQRMFGTLPAYGFFCRHVRNLRLAQVDVACEEDDERPGFVLDDVEQASLADCGAAAGKSTPWLVWAKDCRDLVLSGWRPERPSAALLRVDGAAAKNTALVGNDLTRVRGPVEKGPDVAGDAVTLLQNWTVGAQ